MAFPDRRAANILLTILLFAVVFAILYAARRILLVFAFAILFAYLIDPVVRFLQRHSVLFRNLRRPAVVEAHLAFLLLTVFVGHALAPGLLGPNSKLFTQLPALVDDVSTGEMATEIGDQYRWSEPGERRLKAFRRQKSLIS